MGFFSPAPAKPVTMSPAEIDRRYKTFRWQEAMAMTLGYGIFYVCRLAFSATKKSLIDGNWYSSSEIGWVGSSMLFAYAFGKVVNGFLADRANLRRFMGIGLFVSALMNFIVGWHVPAIMLAVVWFINGFAQATGASASVVAISRWYPKKERGTFYGIFSMSNNFGEALAYVLTSVVMVYAAKWFDKAPIENLYHYLGTWFVSTPPTVDGHYGNGAAWRSGFWGASFLGVLGVLLILKFLRDSPESEGLPPVHVWAKEPPDAAEKAAAGDVNKGQRIALRNWAIWMIAFSGGFFALSRYAIIDWGMFFLQVKKGYAGPTSAVVITINSIVGGFSSAASGYVTDRFFHGRRNGLALVAGLMNVVALSLFVFGPADCLWVDVLAMVLFGIAVGVLLTFLGGLMAVDIAPRVAAGAALGIAGLGNYIGAGIGSIVSGYLIKRIPDPAKMLADGSYVLADGTHVVATVAEKMAEGGGWLLSDGTNVAHGIIEKGAKVLEDGSLLLKNGKLIGPDGADINRFYDFTVNLFGQSCTIDWIAVFWIGMALLSVLCALSVWKVRPRQQD